MPSASSLPTKPLNTCWCCYICWRRANIVHCVLFFFFYFRYLIAIFVNALKPPEMDRNVLRLIHFQERFEGIQERWAEISLTAISFILRIRTILIVVAFPQNGYARSIAASELVGEAIWNQAESNRLATYYIRKKELVWEGNASSKYANTERKFNICAQQTISAAASTGEWKRKVFESSRLAAPAI